MIGFAEMRKGEPMNDLISRLSEILSNYNSFDENEEPYYRALSEAIQLASAQPEERTETPACDLILQTLKDAQPEWLPPADTDLSAYSDKLWRAAYERGKKEAEAERKRGKWVKVSADKYRISASYFYECSKCKFVNQFKSNFCPVCGADMRGGDEE